jgi:hypothetical protein
MIDEAALINEAETGGWDVDIKELKMILKYVPEINAVPVVRCKECKYYENPRLKVFENCCRKDLLTPMKPNDCCSYGERKESEGST